MPKGRNQLSRLSRIADREDGTITYSKKDGYFLLLNSKTYRLGKDSVDALFQLEKILTEHQ